MNVTTGAPKSKVIIIEAPVVNKSVENVGLSGNGKVVEAKHLFWSETMKCQLVSSCLANKAYKKTSINMDTKWEMVAANLMMNSEFQGFALTGPNMKRKFERLKTDVEKKYSLEGFSLKHMYYPL
jgi:hypothetical protein